MNVRKDITSLLNAVGSDLDALLDADDIYPFNPNQPFDEIDALSVFDTLLSDLRKRYLDSKNNHQKVRTEFGADNAMAEIACLLEDSAWCAMQTRYLEIRSDQTLMGKVRGMRREHAKMLEDAARADLLRKNKDKINRLLTLIEIEGILRAVGADPALIWMVACRLLYDRPLQIAFRASPAHCFNRLAA